MTYPVALALTLLVEVPIITGLLTALGWSVLGRGWYARAGLAVAVNLVTHPLLWWLLAPRPTPGAVAGAEVGVVVVETAVILFGCRRRWRDLGWAALVALAANGIAVVVGYAVSGATGG